MERNAPMEPAPLHLLLATHRPSLLRVSPFRSLCGSVLAGSCNFGANGKLQILF